MVKGLELREEEKHRGEGQVPPFEYNPPKQQRTVNKGIY